MHSIPISIFRAYDVRGIVGQTLTKEIIYTLGLAIGSESQQRGERSIITARDGRLSSTDFIEALHQGLQDTGCDVIDIGAVPTPVLYFATHQLTTRSGVMLTGSHNPSEYNGLKIVLSGNTLSGDAIHDLYKRAQSENFLSGKGRFSQLDLSDQYIKRITQDIKLHRCLRVVIDCGNGIAGVIAPRLFRALSCEIFTLFCDVDGRFPNHHPDPSVPKNLETLIDFVKKQKADIGIAFDGDGDRLGVVTNEGEIIWPDRQLMLYAIDVLSRHPGALIIYDVKSTRHLAGVIQQHHGHALLCRTGHSFIKSTLQETGALLAGEMSGHLFFKERWYGFDDALYSAARLLEILSKDTRQASEIFASLPNSINTPELKIVIEEDNKFNFIQKLHTIFSEQLRSEFADIVTIDGLRVEFRDGWGLIRASNTTSHLILRFEADNEAALNRIQAIFRKAIVQLNPDLKLPF